MECSSLMKPTPAVQELCNAIEIRLDHNRSNYVYNQLESRPPHGEKISAWRTWAKFLLPKAQKYLKDMKQGGPNKQLSQVDQFVLVVSRIASVSEDWILDESNNHETLISPLWPTDYASTCLFRDIPRIILASATLVPKTLSLLGIEEKDSIFLSQDHTFSRIDARSTYLALAGWITKCPRGSGKKPLAGWILSSESVSTGKVSFTLRHTTTKIVFSGIVSILAS